MEDLGRSAFGGLRAVERRVVRRRRRRDAGAGRGERLRQDRPRRWRSCACCSGAALRGAARFAGRDLLTLDEAAMRRVRGSGDRHDLPGADDVAESGDARRRADRRGRARASRTSRPREARARALDLFRKVGIAGTRAAAARAIRTSFPAACASA